MPGLRATLWQVDAGGERSAVVPDGCMDLIWTGEKLMMLQRIVRMRTATADLASGGELSSVAPDHGYADDAYMFREVRALTGRKPDEFR